MKSIAIIFLAIPLILASSDTVLEADDQIIKQAGQVQIEQFITTPNLTTLEQNDEMVLSTLLYTPEKTTSTNDFYETAVGNLKRFAPNLRILHLFGGHTFYPEISSPKAIQEEIAYTKDHLKSFLGALNRQQISISSNLLTVMIIADEKSLKESHFEEIISKQFGEDSIIDDSNEDGIELLFKCEGTDIHMYLVFVKNLDTIKKTSLPHGRTPYAISISKYLEPVYDELQEAAKKNIKSDETKLFVDGVRRLNKAGQLHLEEFYKQEFANPRISGKIDPQETLEHLVLSVGVPELNNISTSEFYGRCVSNLRRYAPNLKTVRLDGGYTYNPEHINNETIKNEIIFFHDNLDAVLKAFGDAGIKVSSLKLKVYWLSSKKDADDSGYPALIKSSFDYEPTESDVDSGKVLMKFKLNNVHSNVDLHFFDKAPKELPYGRSNYYSATKLHEAATGVPKSENKENQNQETTEQPRNEETTEQPRNEETTEQPRNEETTEQPRNEETTEQPRNEELSQPKNKETTEQPLNEETTQLTYNEETTQQTQNEETTEQPRNEESSQPKNDETIEARKVEVKVIQKDEAKINEFSSRIDQVKEKLEGIKSMLEEATSMLDEAKPKNV